MPGFKDIVNDINDISSGFYDISQDFAWQKASNAMLFLRHSIIYHINDIINDIIEKLCNKPDGLLVKIWQIV